ncbi:threonylcarbamoyl-AMP synthase [Eggerthellaceae bacterium zg-1084]|uniref:L-threonylcarbamoyladenylate synthase n=1 Tax=Berryella wangjianweii TaxID=2734634 RepID=UPI00155388EB|nr:L-threonylcarbamoyladenylate synthase [Berryella wangjianweii]NPD30799.1 threonylcarbamoyl-AMP synthase [Berryella wangjianweii]
MRVTSIDEAACALRAGEAVVFPTDTVCGLGVAALHASGPEALYRLKGRPAGKPIAWLVGGPEALDAFGRDVPDWAHTLAARFWPGPLTLVVRASDQVPSAYRGAAGTVGLRMPAAPTALRLMQAAGSPLCVTSANRAGALDVPDLAQVDPALAAQVACAVDDRQVASSGQASTVIDCTGPRPVMLRAGAIDALRVNAALAGITEVDEAAEPCHESREAAAPVAEGAPGESCEPGDSPGVGVAVVSAAVGAAAGVDADADADADAAADGDAAAIADDVVVVPLTFPSADGCSQVAARLWVPDVAVADPDAGAAGLAFAPGSVRGVVQLVHGMCEHMGRYDHVARHLVGEGFVVCGMDLIGHGLTAKGPDDLGIVDARMGAAAIVADIDRMRARAQAIVGAEVPFFLFAHSMGSFATRCYLERHADGVRAVVLSGTGHPARGLTVAGGILARAVAAHRGPAHRSGLLDGLVAGGYAKAFPHEGSPYAWISSLPDQVAAYEADPLCGFTFSASAYVALANLVEGATMASGPAFEAVSPAASSVAAAEDAACASARPPVLLVSGDRDPVGQCGAGVRRAADHLRSRGHDQVRMILYPGARHEVHHDAARDLLYADVVAFLKEQC